MTQNFEKKTVTPEVVSTFIDGHDPEERIVNFGYNYTDDYIRVFYRDENDNRCSRTEPFFPFLWATREACKKLKELNNGNLSSLMKRYGIWVKALDITNNKGEVVKEMLDGYTFMFYATKPLSYANFLDFFRVAGNPVFGKNKQNDDKNSFTTQPQSQKEKRQYLIVTPPEQYMIATGKRMFKGYDNYNQTLRMIFDLETSGLNTEKDRIEQFGIRFNREVKYKGQPMKFERTYRIEGDTEEELNRSELANIRNFISIIYTFKPDIITAHNGEAFDWNIIIGACKRLGTTIEDMSREFFDGEVITKNKRETILKLGGEIETFNQTIVPGTIVTDSLHAVRRAQAIDSNMLFSNLKYVTKYSDIAKPDRVYVPGEKISEFWNDKTHRFFFNDKDGDWYIYDPDYKPILKKPDPSMTIEYFQSLLDNDKVMAESGTTQAKYSSDVTAESLYNDYLQSIEEENKAAVYKKGKSEDKFTVYTKNIILDGYREVTGQYIVNRYLLDDLWECDKVEERYNESNFLVCKMLPIPFQKCCTMGTATQWKALMMAWSYENDLAIPMFGETKSFTGGLSRLLKVGYVPNVVKFDYNSLYPSIILTWAIQTPKDLMGTMLAFLEHVLTQREKYKGLKKKFGKEKKALEEEAKNCIIAEKKAEILERKQIAAREETANDKKQLPLKIFGNSYFGSFSALNVFPWGDLACAERVTCTGRMALRLMINHFSTLGEKYKDMINGDNPEDYNYTPIVGDTDGFNFQLPKKYRYTEDKPYISSGLSRETKEGKKYIGFEADAAEFNDLFMRDFHYDLLSINKMGLGIDEVVTATVNYSRKNYSDYFPDEPFPKDVKLVGNTVKSKKMPEYIAKFLERGVRLLLQNKGQEFIEEYYSYIEKIYNYKIPLKQIATKGKVKKSLSDYVKDCQTLTKAGRPKARQAWMEIALKENLKVNMGETLYYINTGTAKSHADVKKVTKYFTIDPDTGEKCDVRVKMEKEWKQDEVDGKLAPKDKKLPVKDYISKHHPEVIIEDEIVLNCKLIPADIVESENDFFCEEGQEYNVPKYIDMFNKRITPLLVCFHPDIRSKILISNPDERPFFTEEECVLCAGYPNKSSDQDTYEQLMRMDDKEIKFWKNHPEWDIPYLKDCGMNWDEIVKDYDARMAREKELGIEAVRAKFNEVIHKMTSAEFDDFEDGILPPSLTSIISVDAITGNFVSKEYPDIVIGTIYDVFDAKEEYLNRMELIPEEV